MKLFKETHNEEADLAVIQYGGGTICEVESIDITKIIAEVEDLHPYKQSGDRDSYSDYSQGWADACDVVLSRLEN